MLKIKLKKNIKDNKKIYIPKYATAGSGALDLHACLENTMTIESNEVKLIGTGICIHIESKIRAIQVCILYF